MLSSCLNWSFEISLKILRKSPSKSKIIYTRRSCSCTRHNPSNLAVKSNTRLPHRSPLPLPLISTTHRNSPALQFNTATIYTLRLNTTQSRKFNTAVKLHGVPLKILSLYNQLYTDTRDRQKSNEITLLSRSYREPSAKIALNPGNRLPTHVDRDILRPSALSLSLCCKVHDVHDL